MPMEIPKSLLYYLFLSLTFSISSLIDFYIYLFSSLASLLSSFNLITSSCPYKFSIPPQPQFPILLSSPSTLQSNFLLKSPIIPMASSGAGTSSVFGLQLTSSIYEDQEHRPQPAAPAQLTMQEIRKMVMNRDSARRSRRKQKLLVQELRKELIQLREDKLQLAAASSLAQQRLLAAEAEISLLRTLIHGTLPDVELVQRS